MNYRLSAQERARHDRMECSDMCPACLAIEADEPRERGGREYDITPDYEDAP